MTLFRCYFKPYWIFGAQIHSDLEHRKSRTMSTQYKRVRVFEQRDFTWKTWPGWKWSKSFLCWFKFPKTFPLKIQLDWITIFIIIKKDSEFRNGWERHHISRVVRWTHRQCSRNGTWGAQSRSQDGKKTTTLTDRLSFNRSARKYQSQIPTIIETHWSESQHQNARWIGVNFTMRTINLQA